jgi:hypothetical protein
MANTCNPPLQFVANGPAGSAFPPPLDPTPPSFTPSPTFSAQACDLLGSELCSAMDPLESIDLLPDVLTAVDGLTAAADANLDAILLELDTVLGQQPINDAFDSFSGAQPGATSLLGDVENTAVPAIGQVPMVLPDGQATITFGGSPATGGVPTAGSAQYVLHLPLLGVNPGIHSLTVNNFSGPNPPFGGVQPTPAQEVVNGKLMYVALVTVNPAVAGTFTGTVYYLVNVTISGITGTLQRQLPFQVVVEP